MSELEIAYLLAVMTPGPSLVLILQNTLLSDKRYMGVFTALGTIFGISLQALYIILGLNFLHYYPIVLKIIQILCGCFLIYIGGKGVIKTFKKIESVNLNYPSSFLSPWVAFKQGFYVDVLNPLALTFFLTIFSLFMPAEAALSYKFYTWLEIIILGALWYVGISYFSSFLLVKMFIQKLLGKNFNFFTSALLIFFGFKMLFLLLHK